MIPEERSQQQWDAIVALLTAELGVGGRLPSVADVRHSVDLWSGLTPAVGVQLQRISATLEFTKKMKTLAEFLVLVSVQSEPSTIGASTVPPNLDDANAILQPIVADGNGGGVANVLRDPANRTLSGLAALMIITGVEYSWEIGRGASGSQQVWSHAIISVQVTDYISIA